LKIDKKALIFLVLITSMPPLSTDLYLPALPTIASELGSTQRIVNLSLVLWFVAFSVNLLVCGAISDKIGRKPVLLTGLVVFVASSIMCAFAQSAEQLILYRILQGAGASAPSAMSLAIVRDRYDSDLRKLIFAYIGMILMVVPMLAPTLGAAILEFSTWEFIFISQGLLSAIPLFFALFFKESIQQKSDSGYLKQFSRFFTLIKNKNYIKTTSTMGLLISPFYAFLAFSPTAYITLFGLSESLYGVFFAVNAVSAMAGSFACSRFVGKKDSIKLLKLCIIGCTFGGFLAMTTGHFHYLSFAFAMLLVSFFGGFSRPLSSDLILKQVKTDIGSASSFLVFYQFLAGAICMTIVSNHWAHPFIVFGAIAFLLPLFVYFTFNRLNISLNHTD
jgi:DHA1 family bicyclomycin/chloramphenicol resistance-like MFS transporter